MPPIRFLMQRLAMFSSVERGKRAARALDRAGWGSGIIRRLQCVRPYVVQVQPLNYYLRIRVYHLLSSKTRVEDDPKGRPESRELKKQLLHITFVIKHIVFVHPHFQKKCESPKAINLRTQIVCKSVFCVRSEPRSLLRVPESHFTMCFWHLEAFPTRRRTFDIPLGVSATVLLTLWCVFEGWGYSARAGACFSSPGVASKKE
jgi:hypothetical protein